MDLLKFLNRVKVKNQDNKFCKDEKNEVYF